MAANGGWPVAGRPLQSWHRVRAVTVADGAGVSIWHGIWHVRSAWKAAAGSPMRGPPGVQGFLGHVLPVRHRRAGVAPHDTPQMNGPGSWAVSSDSIQVLGEQQLRHVAAALVAAGRLHTERFRTVCHQAIAPRRPIRIRSPPINTVQPLAPAIDSYSSSTMPAGLGRPNAPGTRGRSAVAIRLTTGDHAQLRVPAPISSIYALSGSRSTPTILELWS